METIFYADSSAGPSDARVKQILSRHFGMENATILRTKNGKPYVENGPFFSVTHTEKRTYIAVSKENVGIDAEALSRAVEYQAILKRFPEAEREEITTPQEFLTHWTVKESAVKFLGGTLAHDLKKLAFIKNNLTYENKPFPASVTLVHHDGFFLAICGSKRFANAEIVPI